MKLVETSEHTYKIKNQVSSYTPYVRVVDGIMMNLNNVNKDVNLTFYQPCTSKVLLNLF